jgi:hypothetical protein
VNCGAPGGSNGVEFAHMKSIIFILAGTLAAPPAKEAPQPLTPDDPREYQHTHETTYGTSLAALWGNAGMFVTEQSTASTVALTGWHCTAQQGSVTPSTSVALST